jgi:CRISPR-associated endonuclease Csn1
MKRILGLDLGTNSIGWALVEQDFENKQGGILGMGSRIIPMGQDKLSEFGKGNSVSQTAERTRLRSVRRLRERHLLRRERLHRVLNAMGFLPNHYSAQIDFNKKFGQFLEDKEPKLAFNEKDFIFKNSFQEMLKEFRKNQPELVNRKNRKGETAKIPYDWTIYYLRKKALTQKIEKEELAWLILNFNQKRGYYQLRGEEEEENQSRREFVEILEIINIKKGEADKKNKERFWYTIQFKNGWNYSATFASEPHWLNTKREFLVLEEYDDEGSIKIVKDRNKDVDGIEKRKITPLPTFDEINLLAKKDQDKIYKKIKVRTELTIKESGKTVGSYIYENLLRNPNQKIRGKLVRTIERQFYKEELKAIIKKQIELQPELFNNDIYNACIRELYRNNDVHQNFLGNRDFVHLFVEDIIFYQRPLKSKKSLIGNCSLEFYTYKDKNGSVQKRYIKAIPKSNPYYQEFRVWQWLYNLKIFKKEDDTEVTGELIKNMDDFVLLFEFLMTQKEVDHKAVIKHLLLPKEFKGKALTAEIAKYRWNYVYDSEKDESKKYPMNITGYEIRRKLKNVHNVSVDFLNKERELQLWHIIYSVSDPSEFEKALKKFARKNGLDIESFSSEFKYFKPFPSEYGAYSEKAIKKLLPLIRMKKYWNWEDIDLSTQDRIDKIIAAEYDEKIKERVREKTISLTERSHFQGLQLWLAQYVVYGRHSEADVAGKWNTVADLNKFLEGFKQHSLRNPIVEQVITETLRVVGDIWNKFGNGDSNFFNEIHIELGREMKNPSEKREQLTKMIFENENTNLRIKAILTEFLRDDSIENVRPYSPTQQEIFKIYEDGVLNSGIEIPDYVTEIIKKFNETDVSKQPKTSDVNRYKLWLEQKYKSPYTGQPIPLSKLFTSDYEIEHVIPQSRFLDDSFSNKVICEAAVNSLKGNQLGFEFIKNHYGEKVECGQGRVVAILSEEAYKALVKENYAKNLSKRNKLLMLDVPDKMIERQLNDTRYISKYVTNLLSNIVRRDRDDESINSVNLIPGNGKVTSRLKQDWGLNDVWNALILPRFERMNELTKTSEFTSINKEGHMIPTIPLELSKGFQKKRIDHRHHALDALIIACATREHIQYLNNENAKSQKFHLQHGLAKKLRKMEEKTYFKNKKNEKGIWVKSEEKIKREVPTDFIQPWETFTIDAKNHLEKIVISFKQNLRVINKATNTYEKIENGKKVKKKQEGVNWAIRKPMHKNTVSGIDKFT